MTIPIGPRPPGVPDQQRILGAIQGAARRTGVDAKFLEAIARVESGLKPDARATTSSASGLYQFTSGTWLDLAERHGASAGVDMQQMGRQQVLNKRGDVEVASTMAALHTRENAEALQRSLGRSPSTNELYLAHFLGVKGAADFIRARGKDGSREAAEIFPAAAAANRPVFYASTGAARSLDAIATLFERKLAAAGAVQADQPVAQATKPRERIAGDAERSSVRAELSHDARVAAMLALDTAWASRRAAATGAATVRS